MSIEAQNCYACDLFGLSVLKETHKICVILGFYTEDNNDDDDYDSKDNTFCTTCILEKRTHVCYR